MTTAIAVIRAVGGTARVLLQEGTTATVATGLEGHPRPVLHTQGTRGLQITGEGRPEDPRPKGEQEMLLFGSRKP